MGALSTFAAAGMQNLTLLGSSFPSPANVYLGWFTTPPAPDGTGVEVSGSSREEITFLAPVDGVIVQDGPVTWAEFHSTTDQMLAGWGIWDAASGGNLLAFGRTPSYLVRAGRPLVMGSGKIEIASDHAAMSDYLADAWLAHLFRGDTFTGPSTTYLGQFTETPTASTAGTEVASDVYVRLPASWTASGTGLSVLDGLVSWAPLSDDEETLAGWGLLDDETGGHVLWFADWPSPIEVAAGDTFEMADGSVSLKAA